MLALLQFLRRYVKALLVLLAISTIISIILLFLALSVNQWSEQAVAKAAVALVIQLIPNLLAALVAFCIGYVILDRLGALDIAPYIQELMALKNLKAFYTAHKDVPWGDVYENARSLDIGVFYYNHLPKEHFDRLVSFFNRGGKLRLLLIDPESDELLALVAQHFFRGMETSVLKQKILESAQTYYQAFKNANSRKAKCEIWFFEQLFHYTFTYVDNCYLYLSAYGQFEFEPQLLSPVSTLDLSSSTSLQKYWDNQLIHFFKFARRYYPPEKSPWLL